MIKLPNNCWISEPTVNPKNWKTGGQSLLKKDWVIQYYFHDPAYINDPKLKYGKLVLVQGMNSCKDLWERRETTRIIIESRIQQLKAGYNPITKTTTAEVSEEYEISPQSMLPEALSAAFNLLNHGVASKRNIKCSLESIQPAIKALGFEYMPIKEVERRHVKKIIDRVAMTKVASFTNNAYNVVRKDLLALFTALRKADAITYNPVEGVDIKDHAPQPKQLLTDEERIIIDQHLKQHHPRFWLMLHIFFHSGCRTTELMRLQGKHVNIEKQTYTMLIIKGKKSRWVVRPMKDIAVEYWTMAMQGCEPDQYLFAKDLMPGNTPISASQINRRWKKIVKDQPDKHKGKRPNKNRFAGLGINKDWYSLKHLNTDEVSEALDIQAAAKLNAHTTTKMVENVYAVNEKGRKDDRIKKVGNRFA